MNIDNNKTSKELQYLAKDPSEAPNHTKKSSQKFSWYKVQMGQMRARRKRQIEEQTANDMRLLSKSGKISVGPTSASFEAQLVLSNGKPAMLSVLLMPVLPASPSLWIPTS